MFSAALSSASGEAPPNHSGGVGCCTGGSTTLPPSTFRKSPSKSTVSPCRTRRQILIHSLV